MMVESSEKIKETAVQCIKMEAEAVGQLTHFVDDAFVESVKIMFHATEGRIIVTGIGKTQMSKVIKEILPMVTIMILLLLACTYIPQIVMFLPNTMG